MRVLRTFLMVLESFLVLKLLVYMECVLVVVILIQSEFQAT